MKYYLFAVFCAFICHQVSGEKCGSLDTTENEFNECVLSGVWTKPILLGEKYNTETNEDCKWIVKALPQVKKLLESGSDAEDIKTQFQQELCESLTTSSKREMCYDLSDKYYKRVIVLLFLGVPDERIAGLLGVCNKLGGLCDSPYVMCQDLKSAKKCGRPLQCTKFMWATPEFAQKKVSDDSFMCTECKGFISELQQMLSDGATRQEIIDDADNICEKWFSADQCEEYVGDVIGEILMLLENDVSPDQVCALMELCQDSEDKKDESSLSSTDDEVICEGCEALFATLKEYLANEQVVEYIEQEADQLCQYCPEQQQCVDLINTYLPQIIALLQNYLQPDGVCKQMGLCPKDMSAVKNYLLNPEQFRTTEIELDAQRCRNGEECDSSETCCPIDNNQYGCCPMAEAVCCPDQVHCCPEGYTCENQYCMQTSSASNTGFNFAFMTSVLLKTELPRKKRQTEPIEKVSSSDAQPSMQMLLNLGQMFLSQMNAHVPVATCATCKLVMKHLSSVDQMPMTKDELDLHVANLQTTVCDEAVKKGVECPSLEGVKAIMEAAKDSTDDSCPIAQLCSDSPLESLVTSQINDIICPLFESLMTRLSEEQSWNDMVQKVLQWTGKNPKIQSALVQTIEQAKATYGDNTDAASKVKIIREQVYNYVPDLKMCEK